MEQLAHKLLNASEVEIVRKKQELTLTTAPILAVNRSLYRETLKKRLPKNSFLQNRNN